MERQVISIRNFLKLVDESDISIEAQKYPSSDVRFIYAKKLGEKYKVLSDQNFEQYVGEEVTIRFPRSYASKKKLLGIFAMLNPEINKNHIILPVRPKHGPNSIYFGKSEYDKFFRRSYVDDSSSYLYGDVFYGEGDLNDIILPSGKVTYRTTERVIRFYPTNKFHGRTGSCHIVLRDNIDGLSKQDINFMKLKGFRKYDLNIPILDGKDLLSSYHYFTNTVKLGRMCQHYNDLSINDITILMTMLVDNHSHRKVKRLIGCKRIHEIIDYYHLKTQEQKGGYAFNEIQHWSGFVADYISRGKR